MKRNLSRRKSIIRFILAHYQKRGYQPTTREVMWNEKIQSTSTMNQLLKQMKNEGLVDFVEKSPRTLTVTEKGKELLNESIESTSRQ